MGGKLSKPDPSKSLQVICPGLSRTGTSSTALALEKLIGEPSFHGGTHIWMGGDDAYVKKWAKACDAKFVKKDRELTLKLLRGLLDGYTCTIDIPGYLFVPELLELYPDAKVVLTMRDKDRWWDSLKNMLNGWPDGYADILMFPAPTIRWIPTMQRAWRTYGLELSGQADHHQFGPKFLQQWNDRIIEEVPKDRLLVYDITKDGWEPLCKFLDKPIPQEPVPHVNEKAIVDIHVKTIMRKLLMLWAGIISTAGMTAYMGWRFWRRQ